MEEEQAGAVAVGEYSDLRGCPRQIEGSLTTKDLVMKAEQALHLRQLSFQRTNLVPTTNLVTRLRFEHPERLERTTVYLHLAREEGTLRLLAHCHPIELASAELAQP